MASMDLKSFFLALSEPRMSSSGGHRVMAAGRWDSKGKASPG